MLKATAQVLRVGLVTLRFKPIADFKVADDERIIVKPEEIDDYQAHTLAKDIANEIEQTMQYPGQIQVTVIRETRSVSYAK